MPEGKVSFVVLFLGSIVSVMQGESADLNDQAKKNLYYQAQDLIMEEVSAVYIIHDEKVVVTRKWVQNYQISASYIDLRFSEEGRYSCHWERRHVDGLIFRFDNAPHHKNTQTIYITVARTMLWNLV